MASILSGLLTEKPKVPRFVPLDISKIQGETVAENLANLPAIQDLAGKVNKLSQTELDKALEKALPGYKAGAAGIASMLRGEVPQDVQTQLQRNVAEQGVARGTSGSQFDLANEYGTYGRTSYQIFQEGLGAAQRWLAQTTAPRFDFTSMFISPQQQLAVKQNEQEQKWQRDWLAAKIKAIPSGWKAGLINLSNDVDSLGRSIISAYAGGALGGAGGGGGGGSGPGPSANDPSMWINQNPGGSGYSSDFYGRGPQ